MQGSSACRLLGGAWRSRGGGARSPGSCVAGDLDEHVGLGDVERVVSDLGQGQARRETVEMAGEQQEREGPRLRGCWRSEVPRRRRDST
jgi:hypothetical protein